MHRLAALLIAAVVGCGTFWGSSVPGRRFTPTAFSAEVHGHGHPIVLIPGLGCPGTVWRDLTARLDGYQTHSLTLAGFAGQPAIERPLLATARDELARYIRAHRLDHPIIVGHSLGGYLAYWLAATEPGLVGPVVVVDAGATVAGGDPDADSEARQARDAWANASDQEFARRVRESFSAMSVSPARMTATINAIVRSDRRAMGDAVYEMYLRDLRPELRKIRAPLLVVLADGGLKNDYRAQARGVPDHEVVVLPHTGHFVFVDDPDGFVGAIEDFLHRRAAATPIRSPHRTSGRAALHPAAVCSPERRSGAATRGADPPPARPC